MPEVAGSIRAFAMGAAFSLVAAGFAFAVPRAILTTAEQAIVEEAPIEVAQPIVHDTEELEIEPIGDAEKNGRAGKSGGKGEGKNGKGAGAEDNHGAAVSTAARCDVRGRAHGELSSSTAKNKNATVESARDACDEAQTTEQAPPAAESSGGGKSRSRAPEAPKEKGGPKDQSNSGSRTEEGSGSGDSGDRTAPGKSGSAPRKAPKDKGGPKNQSTSDSTIDDDSGDSGDEAAAADTTDDYPGAAASKARGTGPQS